MLRPIIAAAALSASALSAHAEVWMVKSSGGLGCRDRETLVELDATQTSQTREGAPPAGCVILYSGERLLDQMEVGGGFNDYMKVQRGDGTMVFVHSSAIVADPGIGSVTEDRAE